MEKRASDRYMLCVYNRVLTLEVLVMAIDALEYF